MKCFRDLDNKMSKTAKVLFRLKTGTVLGVFPYNYYSEISKMNKLHKRSGKKKPKSTSTIETLIDIAS